MKKIYIIVMISIMILLSLSVSIAESQSKKHSIYRAGINNYGFYRVYNVTINGLAPYKNHTLNINVGDTVTWTNDIDDKATIVSRQGLWNKTKGELKWAYKQFIYTFNKSGKYTFYIKERSKQEQKIIVGPIIIPTHDTTVKNTPKLTSRPNQTPTPIITPRPTSIKVPTPDKTPATIMQTKSLTKNNDLDFIEKFLIPKDLKNRSSYTRAYKQTPGFDIISIITVILITYRIGRLTKRN